MTTKAGSLPFESSWYNDSARYEYLRSDLFWTLAAFIFVNCWWSAKQVDSFDTTPSEQPVKPSRFWLKYRITSRLYKYIVFLLCSLILPLHLLHGSWVLKSAWRITFGLVNRTYPAMRPRILGFLIYSPITAVILLGWTVVLGFGIVIVGTQVLLVCRLWEMTPFDLTYVEEVKDKAEGEGDWQEIKQDDSGSKKDK